MLQTSKPKYSGVSASLTWTTLVPSGDQGRGVATIGHKWGNFGLCCCGWQTVGSAPDEKSFYGVTKGSNKQHEKMLIIMLWSVGWSGHFSAAQSKCAALTGGQVSGHVYTNKDLGLSYTFPESLKAESQDKLPKNKNSRLLLVLWKEPRDLGKPSIIILADDLSQYPDPTVTGY